MLKYILSFAILTAQLVYAQDMDNYSSETVSEWSSNTFDDELSKSCKEDCNRTCVQKCPEAKLCREGEVECGEKDHPAGVWPDCKKDHICVSDGCECQIAGDDGSLCPLWCETECTETQIKCPGGKDDNGCKERDVCLDKPIGNNNQLCPGYCPVECNLQQEHICPEPPVDGCPQPPSCEQKETTHAGEYCDTQNCQLICDAEHIFCEGTQLVDGCYEADICVPKDTSDSGAICDGNCPIMCDPTTEILCDGTVIYNGPKAGCRNDDSCKEKSRTNNGEYCPDNSDSHGCPVQCDEEHHLCPTRTNADGCKEQATCTPCTKGLDGECCPQASDCPALCQPHEKECPTPGTDDNGCESPPTCVVQERDYYGELCTVHCPGICNEGQIMCPGKRDDSGCKEPAFCEPLSKKLWGDDVGDWCPGFCPADCKDWEQLCSAVQDPCDGCPTEPVCKPKAKDVNGINCPLESASHGCAISCKTLDGLETICAAYEDPSTPGCQDKLTCLARTTGTDGSLCPSHSVCPKQCGASEKQCAQGFDDNACKEEDLCIPVPTDTNGQPCLDFECPPSCNEEVQKYCQGEYKYNQDNQLCPVRDYCVDRELDNNGIRCPGHCRPECGANEEAKPQLGNDLRGCPLPAVCEAI